MLLSNEAHVHYRRNALLEVICQIRFPSILKIDVEEPAAFQEQIRRDFPKYFARQEQQPALPGAPVPAQGNRPATITNHNFISADGQWKINLTRDFFSLSTVRYGSWEDFARRFDQPFAKFLQLYQPAYFERIGLRYVNAFARTAEQARAAQWRDWIAPHFLGVLCAEDLPDSAVRKNTVNLELTLPDGCALRTHAGPGMVKRPGQPDEKLARFILDNDLSVSGKLSAPQTAERLVTLHEDAYRVFRGAITDELSELLEPEA